MKKSFPQVKKNLEHEKEKTKLMKKKNVKEKKI